MYYAYKMCIMRIKSVLGVSNMYYAYKMFIVRIKYAICVYNVYYGCGICIMRVKWVYCGRAVSVRSGDPIGSYHLRTMLDSRHRYQASEVPALPRLRMFTTFGETRILNHGTYNQIMEN